MVASSWTEHLDGLEKALQVAAAQLADGDLDGAVASLAVAASTPDLGPLPKELEPRLVAVQTAVDAAARAVAAHLLAIKRELALVQDPADEVPPALFFDRAL